MKKEVTLEQLKFMVDDLPDGVILKITFALERGEERGGADEREPLSDPGSADPS